MRNSIRASVGAVLVSLLMACGGGGGGSGDGGLAFPATGSPAAPSPAPEPAQPTAPTQPDAPTQPAVPAPPAAPGQPTAPEEPVHARGTVRGTVSAKGVPVANATVRVGAKVVTTDAKGNYELEFATADAAPVVIVKSAGYLTMAKQAVVNQGVISTQDFALQAVDVKRTFYGSDGTIVIVNGAVIDIPSNAIKDASGAPYDGPVQLLASYRNPTTAAGIDAFQQPYRGDADGAMVNLQTVGVIEATLTTPTGEPLQLRAQATLVFPGVSAVDRGVATIPLWHYDESRGLWVREGQADRLSDGSYLGKVSHFSSWNLDQQWGGGYTGITLDFCLKLQYGEAARRGIAVYIEGPGFGTVTSDSQWTSGHHSVSNLPAFSALTLRIVDAGNGTTQTFAIAAAPPATTVTLPSCVSLVGTSDYVPTPLDIPPKPVPADTPVNALTGSLSPFTETVWLGNGNESGRLAGLTANADGAIEGFGRIDSAQESVDMASLTGQMAVGGYFTLIGKRAPGSKTEAIGPILFSGRVYIDAQYDGLRRVAGVWNYVNQPTPAAAFFYTPTLS